MPTKPIDVQHMRRCIALARRGAGKTSPNPMVGCVITDRRGRVIAEGYHRRLGGLHAEAEALKRIGGRAVGGTMYVNLEPCFHTSKRRTSPCAPRVLASGIRRLVIGIGDPVRSHAGGGAWLSRQGIEVVRGVLRNDCKELNRAFLTWAKQKRPYWIAKVAMTLDGKTATRTGASQWITGVLARRDAHVVRSHVDAIVVGSWNSKSRRSKAHCSRYPRGRGSDSDRCRQPPTHTTIGKDTSDPQPLICTHDYCNNNGGTHKHVSAVSNRLARRCGVLLARAKTTQGLT